MSEREPIPPSDPQRDVEPHEVGPKKKASPAPLVRATDTGAEVRPLTPVKRYATPLAIAAALALAAGGTAAYAATRAGDKLTTTAHAKAPRATDLARDFTITPATDQPRLAGEMAPPMPTTSSVTPAPSSAPPAQPVKIPPPIVPHQNAPLPPGKPASPTLPGTVI